MPRGPRRLKRRVVQRAARGDNCSLEALALERTQRHSVALTKGVCGREQLRHLSRVAARVRQTSQLFEVHHEEDPDGDGSSTPKLRRIDGWRKIAAVLRKHTAVAA